MSIHLLAVGSNYEGESCELPDCILDVLNVATAFEPFVASAKCLIGNKSTRRGTLSAVRKFLDGLRKGDLGLLYFSGHGTTDKVQGKEIQATVCHDLNLIYETEWRAELMRREQGSMLAMLVDCCYSGGLPRGKRGRTVSIRNVFRHDVEWPTREQKRPNSVYTACRAGEVAYSTGNGGAMTNAFLEEFETRHTNTTLQSLFNRVKKHLPNADYPQHPTAYLDSTMKRRTLKRFAGAA